MGILYLVATPIGNLEDMSYRAIRTLKEADLIAAEDTRNSIKLLNHFEIDTPMTSYHEHNKYDKAQYLVDEILAGKNVALITDAGTPGISDPGEVVVAECIKNGIEVTSIPGPAACINALIISGLSTRRFKFEAFLPSNKKQRKDILELLKDETATMIIYEAPHHLVGTLDELFAALGDRRCAVVKEITKKHETVYRGTLGSACAYYKANEPKGEYVIVIEGRSIEELKDDKRQSYLDMSIEEHFNMCIEEGLDRKSAMKRVALERGISKKDVYRELIPGESDD